jgi:Concanavalin A-like lectin/glucanases superfamily
MAAPVDSGRSASNISTAATSHSINVGSPSAGMLLIVFIRFATSPGTVTFTGYTQLGTADTSDASDDETRVYYRWANGAEGASDPLTTVNSTKVAAICWRITGAEDPAIAVPTRSAVAIGTTGANTANPNSVAPTGAPIDTLYLALMGGDGTGTITAAPTNYTSLQTANSGSGSTAGTNVVIAGASRQIAASSSDDPGVFTHAGRNAAWTAFTVAISAPSPPVPKSDTDTGSGTDASVLFIPNPYAIEVAADSPVAWYRMKEASGLIQDSSGNGNHATSITGTPVYQQASPITGEPGDYGMGFDGDAAFTVPDAASLDLGDVFTLECWLKRSDLGGGGSGYYGILDKGSNGYALGMERSEGYAVAAKSGVGFFGSGSFPRITDTTTWHHVVVTKNGSTRVMYLDGVENDGHFYGDQTVENNALPLVIGGGWDLPNLLLDEIAIYPTALSAARVLAHYNSVSIAPPATLKSGTDSGTGLDEISYALSVSLDAGVGTEITLKASEASDSGVGADSSILAVQLTATDNNGPALENASTIQVNAVSGTDTGAGTDAVILTTQYSLSDTGVGVDASLLPISFTLSDSGSATDSGSVTVPISGTDAGAGTDSAAIRISLTDTGAGVDSSVISLILSDTGSGAEASRISLTVSDIGTGVDVISAFTREVLEIASSLDESVLSAGNFKTGTDSGSGLESGIVSSVIATNDAGSAVDASVIQRVYLGADTGTGTEAISFSRFLVDFGGATEVASQTSVDSLLVAEVGIGSDTAAIDIRSFFEFSDFGVGMDNATLGMFLAEPDIHGSVLISANGGGRSKMAKAN